MAETPDADSKTEAPTPKRRRQAAERGEVLQSRELATLLALAAGVGGLALAGVGLVNGLAGVVRGGLTLSHGFEPFGAAMALLRPLAAPLALFAASAFLGTIAAPIVTKPNFAWGALAPKASRINPLAGLKRMFGLHGLGELGKALLKAALLFGVGAALIGGRLGGLAGLSGETPEAAAAWLGDALLTLAGGLFAALAVIAAIDLPLQIARHGKRLRMSLREVRDESRESEGSPETKAAQRRLARQAAKRALAPALAEATVVMTNPAHFAVALRYRPGRDAAPVVVAKGRDLIAGAIRELAAEKRVPVLRYPELTRAIFFTGRLGQPIRDDLYAAVAVVLAFVLGLEADAAQNAPPVEVPPPLRFDETGRAML